MADRRRLTPKKVIILQAIATHPGLTKPCQIAKVSGIPIGIVNRYLPWLQTTGLVDCNQEWFLTPTGHEALSKEIDKKAEEIRFYTKK